MLSSVLVLVPFLAGINALNDWSVPCTTGQCSYDLPNTNNSASGSMKIWGATNAITDITTAAGWQILSCNATALAQNITLVCMDDPSDPSSQCGHLYASQGAVDKLVRLPENCGANAFARIAKSWVAEDQTIPASARRSLSRRSTTPVVQALAIDTDFDSVDWSKAGPVNIAIQAANVPGAPNDIEIPQTRRGRERRFSVGGALSSLKDGIDNAASDVKGAATKAAGAVKGAATKAAGAVKGAATKAESAVKAAATKAGSDVKAAATKVASAAKSAASDAEAAAASLTNNTIDLNHTFNLAPITFDKSVNLVNQQVACGPVSASLSVDMDANANAQIAITAAAQGTIAPPKLTSFGVVAGMTASVSGTMTLNADVTGNVDSGQIQLVNLGIPGFDFPGIFTVGPSFTVSAEVTGSVDVTMDMTVGLEFDLNNAQLAFPPSDSNKPLSSAFSIGDTPLTLNAAPDVTATGTLTAHLIPSLNLGVNALGGKATAQIFIDLDTNASLDMNLDASASATTVVTPPSLTGSSSASADNSTDTSDDSTDDSSDSTDDSSDSTDDSSDSTDDSSDSTDDSSDSTDDSSDSTDDGSDDSSADGSSDDSSDDGSAASSDSSADSTDDSADDSSDDGADASSDSSDASASRRRRAAAASSTSTADASASTDDSSDSTDDSSDDSSDDSTDDSSDDSTADSTDSSSDDSNTTTTSTTTSTSFGGCVGVNAGIDVNAGATGDFFGLFDKSASAQLFSKSFQIFQKCFGDDATGAATADNSTDTSTDDSTDSTDDSTDDSDDDSSSTASSKRRRFTNTPSALQRRFSLSCPAAGATKKASITKGTVKSSSIKSAAGDADDTAGAASDPVATAAPAATKAAAPAAAKTTAKAVAKTTAKAAAAKTTAAAKAKATAAKAKKA
ncbi:hypothetical protein K438DRAFT_1770082 [Mycena galopus ATCC 62051]|nr:hypothetical protein K438DRAFT_1770082 [Mycena galopus ATCC 62051]